MIGCSSEINFGMPSLSGRRLTVYDIVTKLSVEESVDEAISDYDISLDDIKDALQYCMTTRCKYDGSRKHYCDGCILRTLEEGNNFHPENFREILIEGRVFTVSLDGKIVFTGTLDEFQKSEIGQETWKLAEEQFKRL